MSKTIDKMDLAGETTDEDEIKLEEGCVIVNEKNISFSSYKDGKPWSYKVLSVFVCLYLRSRNYLKLTLILYCRKR